jgi:hypothetical protein
MTFFAKRSELQYLRAGIVGMDLTVCRPQRNDLAFAPPCERRGNSAVLDDLGTTPFNAFLIAHTNDRAQPHAAAIALNKGAASTLTPPQRT